MGINGVTEKDLNLSVALHLQAFLEQGSTGVVLTRSDDNGIYDISDSIRSKKNSDMKNREKLLNASGADAFVSGEVKHHEILDAVAQGLIIYDGGHHATEQPAMPVMQSLFAAACAQNGWHTESRLSMAPPFAGATHM